MSVCSKWQSSAHISGWFTFWIGYIDTHALLNVSSQFVISCQAPSFLAIKLKVLKSFERYKSIDSVSPPETWLPDWFMKGNMRYLGHYLKRRCQLRRLKMLRDRNCTRYIRYSTCPVALSSFSTILLAFAPSVFCAFGVTCPDFFLRTLEEFESRDLREEVAVFKLPRRTPLRDVDPFTVCICPEVARSCRSKESMRIIKACMIAWCHKCHDCIWSMTFDNYNADLTSLMKQLPEFFYDSWSFIVL